MLDEHVLGGGRAALHAVHHHGIGTGLHGQRRVVVGPRRAHLHIDRHLPVGDLAQLADLDLQVVGPGPVGVAAGRALVDPGGQRAHLGDALGDLLAQQHPAAAGLGALAHHHLDGVGCPQIVGVHAVARRQVLVDEHRRVLAFLGGHAAVASSRGGPGGRCSPTERLLGLGRQRAEAHAGDGDGNPEMHRALGPLLADHHVGAARLAVSLQRVARHRRPQEHQVVEGGQPALGSPAADAVDAGIGSPADLGDHVAIERVRLAQVPVVGICPVECSAVSGQRAGVVRLLCHQPASSRPSSRDSASSSLRSRCISRTALSPYTPPTGASHRAARAAACAASTSSIVKL